MQSVSCVIVMSAATPRHLPIVWGVGLVKDPIVFGSLVCIWKENAKNISIAFKSENLPYLKQRLIVVSDYFFLLLHNSVWKSTSPSSWTSRLPLSFLQPCQEQGNKPTGLEYDVSPVPTKAVRLTLPQTEAHYSELCCWIGVWTEQQSNTKRTGSSP
jgi:hypothetical protein